LKVRTFLFSILFTSFFCFGISKTALAEGSSNLGYTVSAKINSKQIDPQKTFFYIQTTPGEEQELEVKVKSTQKEPIKVKIYVTDAFTGDSGTIEYREPQKEKNPLLEQPISSLVKVETPSITVKDFEEKIAKFKLTPPANSYQGVKMGALVFELDNADENEQLTNKFAYRVGIITSETGDEFKNGQTLNLKEVKTSIKRGKKMVLAGLENPDPKIISNLAITAEIKDQKTHKVILKKEVENYMIAPNSQFDFEMDLGTTAVKSGTYVLTLTANNEYKDWKFTKEFIITGDQASKLNKESDYKIVTPAWIKWVTIGEFVLLFGLIIFFIVRRKKLEKIWRFRLWKIRKARKMKKKKAE
jgi:hypothetical protein